MMFIAKQTNYHLQNENFLIVLKRTVFQYMIFNLVICTFITLKNSKMLSKLISSKEM